MILKLINYPSNYYFKLQGGIYESNTFLSFIIKYKHSNLKILDYGCGVSTYLFDIMNVLKSSEGIGVDMNIKYIRINNMVKKANKMNNISFKRNENPYKLDFPDGYFDVIISNHVIEHDSKPELLIKEIRRLLKNDGLLILGTPYKYNKKLVSLSNAFKFNFSPSDHVVEGYTKEELKRLLRGFELIRFEYHDAFFGRILYDIATLLSLLMRKSKEIKIEEPSLFGKTTEIDDLKFNKNIKYHLFYIIGLFSMAIYDVDEIIEKVLPIKGFKVLAVAKALKNE